MTDTNDNIEVGLFERPNRTRFYRVSLRSRLKPGRISQGSVEIDADRIEYQIQCMGGALAEHQYTQYGDSYDPDECAQLALEAYKELEAQMKQGELQIQYSGTPDI